MKPWMAVTIGWVVGLTVFVGLMVFIIRDENRADRQFRDDFATLCSDMGGKDRTSPGNHGHFLCVKDGKIVYEDAR